MPGRNLFATDSNPLPLVPSPKSPPRDLLANDPTVQRQNRLKAIARAGLDASATPLGETASAIGERLKDSFTLGLRGPVTGLSNAIGGALRGDDSTFGERY